MFSSILAKLGTSFLDLKISLKDKNFNVHVGNLPFSYVIVVFSCVLSTHYILGTWIIQHMFGECILW